MTKNPGFTLSVHGSPHHARILEGTTVLSLTIGHEYGPRVDIYTGDATLSQQIADAINGVLEQRRASAISTLAEIQRSAA